MRSENFLFGSPFRENCDRSVFVRFRSTTLSLMLIKKNNDNNFHISSDTVCAIFKFITYFIMKSACLVKNKCKMMYSIMHHRIRTIAPRSWDLGNMMAMETKSHGLRLLHFRKITTFVSNFRCNLHDYVIQRPKLHIFIS